MTRALRQRVEAFRAAWIRNAVGPMPDHVTRRIPTWASTQRGRVVLAGGCVLALTGWAAVFSLIVF